IINNKPRIKIPSDYPFTKRGNNYYFRQYPISKEDYETGIKEIKEKLSKDKEFVQALNNFNKKKSLAKTIFAGIYTANLFDSFILPMFKVKYKDTPEINKKEFLNARYFYNRQKFNKAEKILKKFIQKRAVSDKDREDAYIYLTSIYYNTGRKVLAEKLIEKLFELNHNFLTNKLLTNSELIKLSSEIREKRFASVIISNVPDGTEVYLDGKLKCKTPSRFLVKTGKTYNFGFLKEGYNLVEKKIKVNSNQIFKIKVNLEKNLETGSIIINSEPQGAEVFINDDLKGTTPIFIDNLKPGYYKVRISRENLQDLEKIYSIIGGESTIINVKMKKFDDYLLYSELLPGFGQIKSGHIGHGLFFIGATIGFLSYYLNATKDKPEVFYYSNDLLRTENGKYYIGDKEISRDEYNLEVERINLSTESREKREKYENKKSKIQTIGVLIYLANLIDTYFIVQKDKKENTAVYGNKISYHIYADYNSIRWCISYKF
ncbi:hypothetical protein DRQ09_05145, partial [candidate division KSB1 bacterium]